MPSKVVIAGAGPGDPELITLKTLKYLQQADVVLTDRLVSEALLYQYVNPMAEIIYVGKEGRSNASVSQESINKMLVAYAQKYKLIVRLKGGDVSIFSNILDELYILTQHKINYEIIPGITAASGAAAYSGIPLTARGHSRGVRILTCYDKDAYPESYWNELALTEDTLVFYMSGATLPLLISKLQRHEISRTKSVALIEQATTPQQKVTVGSLDEFSIRALPGSITSPALIIIGTTVNLYEQFKWNTNKCSIQPYFKNRNKIQNTIY